VLKTNTVGINDKSSSSPFPSIAPVQSHLQLGFKQSLVQLLYGILFQGTL